MSKKKKTAADPPERDGLEHARQNAEAWAGSIAEMLEAYDKAEEADDRNAESPYGNTTDDIRQSIEESALSVEVRGAWHVPGAELTNEDDAAEYRILLTTGGPALRIRGELSVCREPEDATLEMQDWGTPWTEYRPGDPDDAEKMRADVLRFASFFYFGE